MKIHFQRCDNLSFLLFPYLGSIDIENSHGGTFTFKGEKKYEEFHAKYLLPSTRNSHVTFQLNGRFFTVHYHNKRNFNYKLEFDNGVLLLLTPRMRHKTCFGKIIVPQPSVWVEPFEKVQSLVSYMRLLIGNFEVKADSIDLSVHTSGFNPTLEDRLHFSGNFRKKQLFPVAEEEGQIFSGFKIGSSGTRSRSPFCRIYDKTLQLRQKHSSPKPHAYYDVQADEKERIWNTEFSFNSRCLKSFDIHTLDQLKRKTPELWKHATTQFLKHKAVPRSDASFKRSKVSAFWAIIQNCHQVKENTVIIEKYTERLQDVDGSYQLNKIKKRILRYSLIRGINSNDLDSILKEIYKDLSRPSQLGLMSWNDFVINRLNPQSDHGELNNLDL